METCVKVLFKFFLFYFILYINSKKALVILVHFKIYFINLLVKKISKITMVLSTPTKVCLKIGA